MVSPFKERIIQIVRAVPSGTVVSYGQIAAYAGLPRAAREVGWTLNGMDHKDLPWWRVINNKGYISIRGNQIADKQLQANLLRTEGIEVDEEFVVDMKKYRYQPSEVELKSLQLEESYIRMLIEKYGL